MEQLLPDYSKWRNKYCKANIIVYFIIILLEIVIFSLLKMNDMILESIPTYIKSYFITPILWISIICFIAFLTIKLCKDDRIKNSVPVISLTMMFGIVSIVHNVFFVTFILFCIPIFMTVVFSNKFLLNLTTTISILFLVHVVHYCYTVTKASRANPYFLPSVLIAIVTLLVCRGIAGTLIDILNMQNHKLLKAAEEAKNAEHEAQQANQKKSAFLSNMSHELRTPMNAIIGLTNIMLRAEHDKEDTMYLTSIKRSANELLGIINDILDFSKIESGKMQIIEESYFFYDMIDNLKLLFMNLVQEKDIKLIYDISPQIPTQLVGDEMRVRQIIVNLVNNAIKFTEHGFVRLAVSVEEIDGNDIRLLFSVKDSGQGIKEEELPRLFDSFEQANMKKNHHKEGSGLGLAICKQLVGLMGGEISVKSSYGEGSEFSFSLHQMIASEEPVAKKMLATSGNTEEQLNNIKFPGAQILLVEDNEINTKIALMLFEPLKMQIDTAENGKIALEMVQNKKYDLVFMDQMMPVMDGMEATKAIRELSDPYYQKLPIIALTANVLLDAKLELLEAGVNDVTTKPILMEDVISILKAWLKKEPA